MLDNESTFQKIAGSRRALTEQLSEMAWAMQSYMGAIEHFEKTWARAGKLERSVYHSGPCDITAMIVGRFFSPAKGDIILDLASYAEQKSSSEKEILESAEKIKLAAIGMINLYTEIGYEKIYPEIFNEIFEKYRKLLAMLGNLKGFLDKPDKSFVAELMALRRGIAAYDDKLGQLLERKAAQQREERAIQAKQAREQSLAFEIDLNRTALRAAFTGLNWKLEAQEEKCPKKTLQ